MFGSEDSAVATLPFAKDQVFDVTLHVAEKMKGFKVKNSDKVLGRINLSTGITATSWGEDIPVQLVEIEGSKTQISIISKSKTGILAGGMYTKKNDQNVETLISNISNSLQGKEIDASGGGSKKSLIATLIICGCLGLIGGHYFYVGKTKKGLLYLFTFGLLSIGWWVDIIRICMGLFTDKDGNYISNW